ncbi:MAG TPA: radical SAM protein, partial [Bdellovibrionota bacterium]|nr:radical SAM protein [Bdellovibrionota bacterium]
MERHILQRPLGVMDLWTFRTVIDRCESLGIEEVEFSGVGEPLLNPHLVDFISFFSKRPKPIPTSVISNGTLLTQDIVNQFENSGLKMLEVTLAPQYGPLTTPSPGSERAQLCDFLAGLSKKSFQFKIIHALPNWSAEQRGLVSAYWSTRGIEKVWFSSRLSCGIMLSDPNKSHGNRPPLCSLFSQNHYVSWEGKLLSCCHDRTGDTCLGDLTKELPKQVIDKKLR